MLITGSLKETNRWGQISLRDCVRKLDFVTAALQEKGGTPENQRLSAITLTDSKTSCNKKIMPQGGLRGPTPNLRPERRRAIVAWRTEKLQGARRVITGGEPAETGG